MFGRGADGPPGLQARKRSSPPTTMFGRGADGPPVGQGTNTKRKGDKNVR